MREDADHHEKLGRRIAAHRAKLGWTQQELAERLAVSRVAVSHLEAGLSAPGERTVALLAGLFKIAPHQLVVGTDYPTAKADRLPVVVAQYTEVETQLRLLEADLAWLEHVDRGHAELVMARWDASLSALLDETFDRRERELLVTAARRIHQLRDQRHPS